MKKLNIASVVTKNCLKEFLLTKFSCEQFNDCNWYIFCDEISYSTLNTFKNINLNVFNVDDEKSNHNSLNKTEKESFLEIILNKFKVIEECLKKEKSVLFLDSDMLFCNTIDENILTLLENRNVDFLVSPHYTNNLSIEEQYGFYNVGMFGLNDIQNINEWKYLTVNHQKLNLYYEQKPFELIIKNYLSLSLPINYNIGWWRFNQQTTKDRIRHLNLNNDEIYFGKLKAINFHFHVFKEPNGYNPGKFLVNHVFSLLKNSNNKKYYDIIKYYEQLSKEPI
jgi:hypothetical protein